MTPDDTSDTNKPSASGGGGNRPAQRLGRGLSALLGEEAPVTPGLPAGGGEPASGRPAEQTPAPAAGTASGAGAHGKAAAATPPAPVAPAVAGVADARYGALGPTARGARMLAVDLLQPGRFQPRHAFAEEEMKALADSVRQRGVLQPVLVRPLPGQVGRFEIVAGERRWRAAQRARLHEIPVVVRELEDSDALEFALIENIQRQDLSPIEEAEAYQRLVDEFGHTQDALARDLNKSRSYVANALRMLSLPEPVRRMVDEGRLSAGHGRALISAPDPTALAMEAVRRGLSVRQTEGLARRQADRKAGAPRGASGQGPVKDADTRRLEQDLSALLGLRVTVRLLGKPGGGQERGELIIHYKTLEQLDDVLRRLQRGGPMSHEQALKLLDGGRTDGAGRRGPGTGGAAAASGARSEGPTPGGFDDDADDDGDDEPLKDDDPFRM
ncbi:MAG: ParB/RepB/Spo0J family partition protein [Alphaproteobacteria bacterium]